MRGVNPFCAFGRSDFSQILYKQQKNLETFKPWNVEQMVGAYKLLVHYGLIIVIIFSPLPITQFGWPKNRFKSVLYVPISKIDSYFWLTQFVTNNKCNLRVISLPPTTNPVVQSLSNIYMIYFFQLKQKSISPVEREISECAEVDCDSGVAGLVQGHPTRSTSTRVIFHFSL